MEVHELTGVRGRGVVGVFEVTRSHCDASRIPHIDSGALGFSCDESITFDDAADQQKALDARGLDSLSLVLRHASADETNVLRGPRRTGFDTNPHTLAEDHEALVRVEVFAVLQPETIAGSAQDADFPDRGASN